MGIKIEFNPELALRNISEIKNRYGEECIPENLQVDNIYNFLKAGQRVYYMEDIGKVHLLETKGNENLGPPLAEIKIIEVTHFIKDDKIWTKGKYKVLKLL